MRGERPTPPEKEAVFEARNKRVKIALRIAAGWDRYENKVTRASD
jgi:hypothetical protein